MSQSIIDLSRRAFIGGAAALGATSLIIPEFAFAETAAEKQAEADAVRNQLVGLQADLETAGENYYAALDEQESAQRSMEEQQVKIDETTQEIEGLQDRLSTRARSMYRSGSTTFIDFPVFNVADIGITVGVVLALIGYMFLSPAAREVDATAELNARDEARAKRKAKQRGERARKIRERNER